MWKHLLRGVTINSHSVGTLIALADDFLKDKGDQIPFGVSHAWIDFRFRLVEWKEELQRQEDGRR